MRVANIPGWRLCKGGDYTRVAIIQGSRLYQGDDYARVVIIRVWHLINEVQYLMLVHNCTVPCS